jgi:hypothetical protein
MTGLHQILVLKVQVHKILQQSDIQTNDQWSHLVEQV